MFPRNHAKFSSRTNSENLKSMAFSSVQLNFKMVSAAHSSNKGKKENIKNHHSMATF